jgi:tetratricopeptide (TPR) repeat protein
MSTAAPESDQPTGIGRLIGSSAALFLFFVAIEIAPLPAPGESAAPPSAETRQMQDATALMAANKWADALAPVQALSRAYPGNHIYAERLATIYEHLNKPVEEAAAWERFVATSPTAYEACPRIGDAYRRAGQLDNAIDAFERCLTYEPDNRELQFYAAHAAEWKNDWATAQQLYAALAAASPANTDVQLGLGRIALHEGRLKDARAIADAVLANKDDSDAALLGGMAAQRAGQNADARAYFDRGLRRSPEYADLHYFMGLLEESEGHAAAAAAQFARALALDPARHEFQAHVAKSGAGK